MSAERTFQAAIRRRPALKWREHGDGAFRGTVRLAPAPSRSRGRPNDRAGGWSPVKELVQNQGRSQKRRYMKTLVNATLLLTLVSVPARAQINAGELKPEASLPFTMTQVATFKLPWRVAFLPDGRMLVTEKVGPVWLVTQQGEKTPVENVPAVLWQGQGGMLGVFLSPKYATDHNVYLTYSEPGDEERTSSLALARARLALGEHTAGLEGLQVLWRDMPKGRGGQFGAQIAFSPDG